LPFYDYTCPECGHQVKDVLRKVEQRDDTMVCDNCLQGMDTVVNMRRDLASPNFNFAKSPYEEYL